jgi:hypothetical protein
VKFLNKMSCILIECVEKGVIYRKPKINSIHRRSLPCTSGPFAES